MKTYGRPCQVEESRASRLDESLTANPSHNALYLRTFKDQDRKKMVSAYLMSENVFRVTVIGRACYSVEYLVDFEVPTASFIP